MPRFFTRIDATILHAGRPVETIDPAKAAAVLCELRGVSAALATAIAAGALGQRGDAVAVARRWGLVEKLDTTDARDKRLIK